MNESETRPKKWPAAIAAALFGVVYGVAVAFLALLCTGAGHGWMSGCISGYGIILVPLASVAWIYRGTVGGRALAIVTLISVCAVDIYLLNAAQSEGFSYFHHAMSVLPFLMLPWLVLWVVWQVALAAFVFRDVFQSNRNT